MRRRNTVFGAVDPEGKAEPKWKVQANFTGQLDIHDIVSLKLTNDQLKKHQPKHNWLGSAEHVENPPEPFGARSRGAAREFNVALLHERFGRAKQDARRRQEDARKARANKERAQRERDARRKSACGDLSEPSASSVSSAGSAAWSPLAAYNRHTGESGVSGPRARTAPSGSGRGRGAGRGMDSVEPREGGAAFPTWGSYRRAPAYSLGAKHRDLALKPRTQGPIYYPEVADRKGVESRYVRPPHFSLAGKLELGGFLEAAGGAGGRSNDGRDLIGLGHADLRDGGKMQDASRPRGTNRGIPFGGRHATGDTCKKKWLQVGHHNAMQAFQYSIGPTGVPGRSLAFKLPSAEDLTNNQNMPGPGEYRQYRTVAEDHPTFADFRYRSGKFGESRSKVPSALDPNKDMANVAPGHVGAPNIEGCSRHPTAPRFSFAKPGPADFMAKYKKQKGKSSS